jgi:hypothetical protein
VLRFGQYCGDQEQEAQSKVDAMRGRIAKRDAQRAEAVASLKTLSGVAEFVSGKSLSGNWAKLCRNSCSSWGEMNAFTRTSVPNGIQIEDMDCKGEYEFDGKIYPFKFNCGSGKVKELDGKTIALTYDPYSAKDSNGDYLVPSQYEEAGELRDVKRNIELAMRYQNAYQ